MKQQESIRFLTKQSVYKKEDGMVDYDILEQFVQFYQTGTLRKTAEKMHISVTVQIGS